jgi:hypothetical protein
VVLTKFKTVALTTYTLVVGGLLVASRSLGAVALGVGLCGIVPLMLFRGLDTPATD